MTEPFTVIIPAERGKEWNKERATFLPPGTPYLIAEHDEGEFHSAVNDGVKAAGTPLVVISAQDVWFEREPEAVEFFTDLCWNADVTYGKIVKWQGDEPKYLLESNYFCPHRLTRENYLPPIACVRRDKFLEHGGITSGFWDLWSRMSDQGARFKYVPEAITARDGDYEDPSPLPEPHELLATFYHQSTPGTTYWRCLLPARELPGQAIFAGPVRLEGKDGKIVLPQHAGTAVFQFTGSEEAHVLLKWMREQGIRVLAEVDDNYTRWFPWQMKPAGWGKKIGDAPFTVEGHLATVEMLDGVICASEYLAKQYRPYNKNVYVCPNQIDPDDWEEPVKPDDGKFRIGWFSSGSHKGDGELIRRGLEWASRQPDVEVVMVGLGATNGKPSYPFPFKHVPWSNDFGVYRRFIGELDVGLAPVVASPWALCRSSLKALEYGAAGALPLVSDVPPYDDVDVPKAKTPKDFLREIQRLVGDREGTRQRAREWRDYVLRERTVKANIGLWREAVAG